MNNKAKFKTQCEEASEITGVSLSDTYEEKDRKLDAFEDDECLHICKYGVRACFDVGGDNYTGKQQNARARAVLTVLGLEKLISARVLVEETEEEE